jgi:hypothetical protein
MKKERVRIQEVAPSRHKSRGFRYYRPTDAERLEQAKLRAAKQEQRRLDRLKIEATSAADSYVTRLMNEAAAAQRLVKDAKAYEAECWAKLSRYLLDGTRDDGKKPRIRIIIDHDDVPARGQQGAR